MDRPTIRKSMRRRERTGDWGVRFVTFSCQRRLPLFSNPRIADEMVTALVRTRERFGMKLFAWVVMPEHVHLPVRPQEGTRLADPLRFMKQSVAGRVLERWREIHAPILARLRVHNGHRFWQKGGGFDRNVRDDAEFSREVRYVHHNPVERALVTRPEDWTWSSVRWWMGEREGEVECDPPPGKGWDTWTGYR